MSDPKFMNFSSTNFHCKKMINSLKMGINLKIKGEMEIINLDKKDLRKINKIKKPLDYVNKICDMQNQKFGKIVNFQTDYNFLRERSLPKIQNEVKEIEINNNFYNNGNSKFMGGNYNPYNYDLFASKNRIKRNVFGTLFIN